MEKRAVKCPSQTGANKFPMFWEMYVVGEGYPLFALPRPSCIECYSIRTKHKQSKSIGLDRIRQMLELTMQGREQIKMLFKIVFD